MEYINDGALALALLGVIAAVRFWVLPFWKAQRDRFDDTRQGR